MQFKPYTGSERTLHTHLSADECMRRLRDEVYAHPALIKPSTWQPLRHERSIERKIDQNRFMLRSEKATKWIPRGRLGWFLYGKIEALGVSTINIQYRLWLPYAIIWWAWIVLFAGQALLGVTVLAGLAPRVTTSSERILFGGFLLIFGVFALWLLVKNGTEREGEQWLIDGLKQLLDAEES